MAQKTSFLSFFQTSFFRMTSLFSLSSLMPFKRLSKHLFRPAVYAHTYLSLPTVLSILSASEMLVEASELFSECSLVPFTCVPNAHSNHCLFTVYLILDCDSNCSSHSFVSSFSMPLVLLLKSFVILIWSAVSFPYEHRCAWDYASSGYDLALLSADMIMDLWNYHIEFVYCIPFLFLFFSNCVTPGISFFELSVSF